jgi:hypothetical protein
MYVTRTFELKSKEGVKARITISAANITGAEQNLVILDGDDRPVAVLEMQPGIDRYELRNNAGDVQDAAAGER